MNPTLSPTRRQTLLGLTAAAIATPAAAAGEPITIGFQTELTGALSHDGMWGKRAVEAAVEWQNTRGGVAGRPLKLITVDTETKPDVGVRRLQQLIKEDNCNFIVGSGHGGVGMASVPIARDARVIYLPLARTDGITTDLANPYVIRLVSDSTMGAVGAAKWMVESLGKRWAILMADYAFGYSQRDAFKAALEKQGGTLAQIIPLPVNTSDPLPYLLKLDHSIDGIIMAILGPDSVRVYPALKSIGFGDKAKLTVSSTQNLFDIVKLGPAVESLYALDEVPWELADYPDPALAKTAFDKIGIGPNGRAKDKDDYVMLPNAIFAWEYVDFIRQAVEGAKWASAEDNLAVSKWLGANPDFKLSEGMPQGRFTVRAADQQAFADQYILQIKAGHMRQVAKVPGAAAMYPVPAPAK